MTLPDPAVADHILSFARVLRGAGLEIGTGQALDAIRAVATVGVRRRDDVYHALRSTLVTHRGQLELFDQAFDLFWATPNEMPDIAALLMSRVTAPPSPRRPGATRVRRALGKRPHRAPDPEDPPDRFDAALSYSDRERLAKKDFADYTVEDIARAKAFLRDLHWPIAPQRIRRRSPFAPGRLPDLRRTTRGALRTHGEFVRLAFQGRKRKPRPVVILCDISGSMERYARMLLHFMHAVAGDLGRVESFVFGTRLTRITRALRRRDIDEAVLDVSGAVDDWGGGTRIGESVQTFNRVWLRRVLRSNGVVLIVSDGCDRGDPDVLDRAMDRLARSCHRLIWLNPLLRFDGYEPLTEGMRTALPYVDDFLPVHNLASLEQLGEVLGRLER